MPVALIAAGVSAAGAVAGGAISARAASKARKAQERAGNSQIALQREQDAEARRRFDQERADLAPYREAGTGALGQLVKGTQDGGDFNRDFTLADFIKEPGYDFRQREGQRGVESSASARGGILSGGALKALSRYNQEYASNEYGNAYNRFNNDRSTRYNRLASLAGVGQASVNSGNAASQNLTNNLQAGVNNQRTNLENIGDARASQYLATGRAIGNTIGNIAGGLSISSLYRGGAGQQGGNFGGGFGGGFGTPGINPNAPSGIQKPRFFGGYYPYGT